MPALPTSVSFTDSGVTEAQFKTAITNQREFLAGLLGTTGTVPTAITALGNLGSTTLTKSSAYTVVAADRGALIECTGTFTLSLTAAATLATGFVFAVFNKGTGIITIDPASTELINGASTLAIAANSWAIVSCTGTAFNSLGSVPATGSLIGYQVFTASGTYTKATNNPSFVIVEVVGGGGGQTGGGGTSSFGAFCSATGGGASPTGAFGAAGGTGSGGDINSTGQRGLYLTGYGGGGIGASWVVQAAGGVSPIPGFGTGSSSFASGGTIPGTTASAGGGGYSRERILATSLATSETVTIGAAGAGAGSLAATAGIVIVWEYQ